MFYVLLFIGLYVSIASTAYHFQFEHNNYNNYILHVCIGSKEKCYPFKISTVTNEIIVFSDKLMSWGYNPDESEGAVIQNTTAAIMHNSDYYAGRYVYDKVFLKDDDITLPFVQFILADQKSTDNESYYGILGVYIGITNTENTNTLLKMLIEQKYITKHLITFGHHELELGDDSIFDNKIKSQMKQCSIKDKKSMFTLESCECNGVFYVSKRLNQLRNNGTLMFEEPFQNKDSEIILKFYVFYRYLQHEKCSESIDITKTKKFTV